MVSVLPFHVGDLLSSTVLAGAISSDLRATRVSVTHVLASCVPTMRLDLAVGITHYVCMLL